MKDNELWLIEESRKGNVDAFEKLIKEHKKSAYNIALRVLRNVQDAEDISQEALIKVFKSIENFNMQSTFKVWMYRIVVNTCLDFKRKKMIDTYSIDEPIGFEDDKFYKEIHDNTSNPDDMLEKSFNQKLVNDALNKLEEDFKTVVILRDIKEFSYKEIADILNLNEGTVKSRINRARKKLREVIEKEMENDN